MIFLEETPITINKIFLEELVKMTYEKLIILTANFHFAGLHKS